MRKAKQTGLTDISHHLNLGRRGYPLPLGSLGQAGCGDVGGMLRLGIIGGLTLGAIASSPPQSN